MRKSRRQRQKNKGFNPKLKHFTLAIAILALSGFAYTSVASSTDGKNWHKNLVDFSSNEPSSVYSFSYIATNNFPLLDATNYQLVADAQVALDKTIASTSEECANPEKTGSLAKVQKDKIEQQRQADVLTTDIDQIFNMGSKGGCFDVLNNFPDLSTNIPSIAGMLSDVKSKLQEYALRKACTAVDNAIEEAVSPLSDVVDDISSRGVLDLNGVANDAVKKQMYEIDPALSNTYKKSKSASERTYTW